jgi:hypothetical protein
MSRKDYRAIAEALRTTDASKATVQAVAAVFARDNSRFDWDCFTEAAGR